MAVTLTERLGLTHWSADTDPQDRADFAGNVTKLDQLVAMYGQGTLAARPASGKTGRFYMVTSGTDNGAVFYDTGAEWRRVTPTFAAPGGSAFGDTASEGVATTAARSDHRHAREAGITIARNGAVIGTRPRINIIQGAGITVTAADDPQSGEVDLTLSATTGTALVRRVYDPDPFVQKTQSSTNWADLDPTLVAPFVVPASGAVIVRMRVASASNPGGGGGLKQYWALRDAADVLVPKSPAIAYQGSGAEPTTYEQLFTGLTPGDALTWKWAWAAGVDGNTVMIVAGRTGGALASQYGPAIMEVWAA